MLGFQPNDSNIDDAVFIFEKNGFEFWGCNLEAADFDELLFVVSRYVGGILCWTYLFAIDDVP
jgi:hypothetical protein